MVSALTSEWTRAETVARGVIAEMGFSHIHNLNDICSSNPCWDYVAEKEGKSWLIDVTINGQKSISAKRDAIVDGYEHAILLLANNEWKLIRLTMNVEMILPETTKHS